MKRLIVLFYLAAYMLSLQAQSIHFGPLHSSDSPREDWLLPGDTIRQDGEIKIYNGKPVKNIQKIEEPKPASPITDLTYGWGLHRGLNVSLDLSAFATFGKNAPHRGGFGQSINATYLAPLTRDGKLWIAGGGYFNNTTWGGDSFRDVGLYAILGYKFNEHWEAYVYGQLSINNNFDRLYGCYAGYGYPYGYGWMPGLWGPMCHVMPMGYGMGMPGANVLGAGVKYNVNKNFSIGLSIEGVWYDNSHSHSYFDRYNYPVPDVK